MAAPILQFPTEVELIAAEAQALARLSPSDRFLALVDHLASGEKLLEASPHAPDAIRLQNEQEEEWQRIHQELFHCHGY